MDEEYGNDFELKTPPILTVRIKGIEYELDDGLEIYIRTDEDVAVHAPNPLIRMQVYAAIHCLRLYFPESDQTVAGMSAVDELHFYFRRVMVLDPDEGVWVKKVNGETILLECNTSGFLGEELVELHCVKGGE